MQSPKRHCYLRRVQEDVMKNCNFLPFEEEGLRMPNGSYTGAIGAVIAQRSDFALRFHNM